MSLKEKEGVLKAADNMVIAAIIGFIFVCVGVYLLFRFTSELDAVAAAIFSILIGLTVLLLVRKRYVYINKNEGVIHFGSMGLLGRKERKISISDVVSVEYDDSASQLMRKKFIGDGNSKYFKNRTMAMNTSIFLILKNDVYLPVPFTSIQRNRGIGVLYLNEKNPKRYISKAQQVASFLNVPFVERKPPADLKDQIDIIKDNISYSKNIK
jgi:hypothetical protein